MKLVIWLLGESEARWERCRSDMAGLPGGGRRPEQQGRRRGEFSTRMAHLFSCRMLSAFPIAISNTPHPPVPQVKKQYPRTGGVKSP